MSDYSGIGDAMVVFAVLAAFAVPAFLGCLGALVLVAFGFSIAGFAIAAIGIMAGIGCALFVRSCA